MTRLLLILVLGPLLCSCNHDKRHSGSSSPEALRLHEKVKEYEKEATQLEERIKEPDLDPGTRLDLMEQKTLLKSRTERAKEMLKAQTGH